MTLTFDASTHAYCLDGKHVPSVTDITRPLSRGKYTSSTLVLNQARQRGTLVHEYCEYIDYGFELTEIQPQLIRYLTAYQRFIRDYRPEWLFSEQRFGSRQGFAGTVDRIGLIGKKLAVVDLKTTASMDRAAKISLAVQTVGYDELYRENGGERADLLYGVQLKKDGTYTVHDCDNIMRQYDFDAYELFCDLLRIEKLTGGYR